jgi:hypothetical protein
VRPQNNRSLAVAIENVIEAQRHAFQTRNLDIILRKPGCPSFGKVG